MYFEDVSYFVLDVGHDPGYKETLQIIIQYFRRRTLMSLFYMMFLMILLVVL